MGDEDDYKGVKEEGEESLTFPPLNE